MTLAGIPDIPKVYISQPEASQIKKLRIYINEEGEIKHKRDWMLETDGSNMLEVMCDQDVDRERTETNDICEGKSLATYNIVLPPLP